jgi:DNA polymerase III alpha subunit
MNIKGNKMKIKRIHSRSGKGKEEVRLIAKIDDVIEVDTKRSKMSFLKISDETSAIECIVFPKNHMKYRKYFIIGNLIEIKGQVNLCESPRKIFLENVRLIDEEKI